MTREEIEELKGLAASMGLYDDKKPCKRAVILGKAINALEQEPCDDCISRQKAIDAIDALYLDGDSSASFRADANGDALIGKYQAITALDDLPSVTAHPKMGQWEWVQYDGNPNIGNWNCSECHCIGRSYFDYCPNCGAKMQGVEE